MEVSIESFAESILSELDKIGSGSDSGAGITGADQLRPQQGEQQTAAITPGLSSTISSWRNTVADSDRFFFEADMHTSPAEADKATDQPPAADEEADDDDYDGYELIDLIEAHMADMHVDGDADQNSDEQQSESPLNASTFETVAAGSSVRDVESVDSSEYGVTGSRTPDLTESLTSNVVVSSTSSEPAAELIASEEAEEAVDIEPVEVAGEDLVFSSGSVVEESDTLPDETATEPVVEEETTLPAETVAEPVTDVTTTEDAAPEASTAIEHVADVTTAEDPAPEASTATEPVTDVSTTEDAAPETSTAAEPVVETSATTEDPTAKSAPLEPAEPTPPTSSSTQALDLEALKLAESSTAVETEDDVIESVLALAAEEFAAPVDEVDIYAAERFEKAEIAAMILQTKAELGVVDPEAPPDVLKEVEEMEAGGVPIAREAVGTAVEEGEGVGSEEVEDVEIPSVEDTAAAVSSSETKEIDDAVIEEAPVADDVLDPAVQETDLPDATDAAIVKTESEEVLKDEDSAVKPLEATSESEDLEAPIDADTPKDVVMEEQVSDTAEEAVVQTEERDVPVEKDVEVSETAEPADVAVVETEEDETEVSAGAEKAAEVQATTGADVSEEAAEEEKETAETEEEKEVAVKQSDEAVGEAFAEADEKAEEVDTTPTESNDILSTDAESPTITATEEDKAIITPTDPIVEADTNVTETKEEEEETTGPAPEPIVEADTNATETKEEAETTVAAPEPIVERSFSIGSSSPSKSSVEPLAVKEVDAETLDDASKVVTDGEVKTTSEPEAEPEAEPEPVAEVTAAVQQPVVVRSFALGSPKKDAPAESSPPATPTKSFVATTEQETLTRSAVAEPEVPAAAEVVEAEVKPEQSAPAEPRAAVAAAAAPAAPEVDESEKIYIYTSLTGGIMFGRNIMMLTRKLQTILQVYGIEFQVVDIATNEKAKKLWARQSKGRKLPGVIKGFDIVGNYEEIAESHEYGEVQMLIEEFV
ncbi:hypothetical protein BZA70DRAFT_280056 [Myxozyma melibiosi]|uniref:Glutaredoxin domain-containing protein n=1 Tax=Myxozyma melibiosi TaxID=54550 RepID=A0ABR1F4Q7_9ASCO